MKIKRQKRSVHDRFSNGPLHSGSNSSFFPEIDIVKFLKHTQNIDKSG